jgi:2-keto-4-pentenoate hydratase/2-oxohepta-3-ene-1,7-dioic acid hydratase in catechol pathway
VRAIEKKASITHELAALRLLAPLTHSSRTGDLVCFEKPVRQARPNRYLFGQGSERLDPAKVDVAKAWYRSLVYYKGNVFSIVGPDAEVHSPKYSRTIDYELEIAPVTPRCKRDVPKAKARSYVFGYMIFNDFSARDEQYLEMQAGFGPAKGKGFDASNAIGPWLATADEIADPQDLTMIAYVAADETFHAGEILGSGTVGGGCGNELGRFMKHGDVIELEVPGRRVLRNRIVAPHVLQRPALPMRLLD